MLTDTPRRAEVAARRSSVLVRVSRAALDRLAAEDPDCWRRVAQLTVAHLDHALSTIAGLSTPDSRTRVAMALRRVIDPHRQGTNQSVSLALSQDALGEIADLNRNVVAAALRDLEATGVVIRRYRRIEIPDIASLDRYIEARAG